MSELLGSKSWRMSSPSASSLLIPSDPIFLKISSRTTLRKGPLRSHDKCSISRRWYSWFGVCCKSCQILSSFIGIDSLSRHELAWSHSAEQEVFLPAQARLEKLFVRLL